MRSSDFDLSVRLYREPYRFNLFQAISLLEREAPERMPVGTGDGVDEAVMLNATLQLGFEPSDIVSIREADSEQAIPTLATPLMSLGGASGPLPLPFTEMLLTRGQLGQPARAFIDIFHHRWISFLYRSRKKHNLGLEWKSPENSPFGRVTDALSGLGRAQSVHGPGGETPWLRHAGLQNGAPRSMANLLALLTDRLSVRVLGRQFVGGWYRLSQLDTPPLGQAVLGQLAVLGRRAWDQAAGIELRVGPVQLRHLDQWLPGGRRHLLMDWLVRRHAQRALMVTLIVEIEPVDLSAMPALGAARLGWCSWLQPRASANFRIPLRSVALSLSDRRTDVSVTD